MELCIIQGCFGRRLPSFDAEFTASTPLTRVRDIAHRSDIPHELKQEIKHTIQVAPAAPLSWPSSAQPWHTLRWSRLCTLSTLFINSGCALDATSEPGSGREADSEGVSLNMWKGTGSVRRTSCTERPGLRMWW